MIRWPKFGRIVDVVAGQLIEDDSVPRRKADSSLQDDVDSARRDWESARSYFETVTDPDLIDHAIYAMEAAERKYMYLLRLAREKSDQTSRHIGTEPLGDVLRPEVKST